MIILQANEAESRAQPSSLTRVSGDSVRRRRGYKIRNLASEQQLGNDSEAAAG